MGGAHISISRGWSTLFPPQSRLHSSNVEKHLQCFVSCSVVMPSVIMSVDTYSDVKIITHSLIASHPLLQMCSLLVETLRLQTDSNYWSSFKLEQVWSGVSSWAHCQKVKNNRVSPVNKHHLWGKKAHFLFYFMLFKLSSSRCTNTDCLWSAERSSTSGPDPVQVQHQTSWRLPEEVWMDYNCRACVEKDQKNI